MNGRSRDSVTVNRDYRPSADSCTEALRLLLTKSRTNKAAEATLEPDGRDYDRQSKTQGR
jgi:hypothetical protein